MKSFISALLLTSVLSTSFSAFSGKEFGIEQDFPKPVSCCKALFTSKDRLISSSEEGQPWSTKKKVLVALGVGLGVSAIVVGSAYAAVRLSGGNEDAAALPTTFQPANGTIASLSSAYDNTDNFRENNVTDLPRTRTRDSYLLHDKTLNPADWTDFYRWELRNDNRVFDSTSDLENLENKWVFHNLFKNRGNITLTEDQITAGKNGTDLLSLLGKDKFCKLIEASGKKFNVGVGQSDNACKNMMENFLKGKWVSKESPSVQAYLDEVAPPEGSTAHARQKRSVDFSLKATPVEHAQAALWKSVAENKRGKVAHEERDFRRKDLQRQERAEAAKSQNTSSGESFWTWINNLGR